MSIFLVIIIGLLFIFLVLASIGGLVALFSGQVSTAPQMLGLATLIFLTLFFGVLLFSGKIVLY